MYVVLVTFVSTLVLDLAYVFWRVCFIPFRCVQPFWLFRVEVVPLGSQVYTHWASTGAMSLPSMLDLSVTRISIVVRYSTADGDNRFRRNLSSHSGGYEEFYLLAYNNVWSVESQATFWNKTSSSSAWNRCGDLCWCLAWLILSPENGAYVCSSETSLDFQ
jgi:hypothetical protein